MNSAVLPAAPASASQSTSSAWISRILLLPPVAILLLISHRCITDPLHALAASGITYSQPEPVTDTRVVGALSLTLAVLLAAALFSRRRLRDGHVIVVVVMTLALGARMLGFALDGTRLSTGSQRQKTIGECVFLVANAAALAAQGRRRESR